MPSSPMIEQVNRLIGNLLAGGGSVALPGVGTLAVQQRGARRIAKKKLQLPCRAVSFSSQLHGGTLPEEIARAVRDAAALRGEEAPAFDAQSLYNRWLEQVYVNDVLTISGVGILKFKNFTPDAAFDKRMNPQGHATLVLRSRRRFDWALWVGSITILGVLAYGGYIYLNLPDSEDAFGLEPMEEVAAPVQPEAPIVLPADTVRTQTDSVQTAPPAEQPAPQPATVGDEPQRMESGVRYVVLGVFSSVKNAQRAAKGAADKNEGMRQCAIYYFGEKYIVSPFADADAERCTQFILDYSEAFPGMWTYTAR